MMKKYGPDVTLNVPLRADTEEKLHQMINRLCTKTDELSFLVQCWLECKAPAMTLNEYQKAAERTQATKYDTDKILNGVLGLAGESGECADLVKKHFYQDHGFPKDKLIEEAGDVLWYIAELACGLNVTMEEIAQRNIDKLKKRYPDGFSADRSINREE